ncbi:hypothetical protein FOA52_014063 [Chlamydomonas sp. UWO 241]|nr:hypothetical protein FOA52_014063 [Chlamydomonas sp. UWO 241]
MVTISLYMSVQGSSFAFPDSWTMALEGKISRAEFSQIVAALNDTCKQAGPGMGASRGLFLIPIIGMGFMMYAHKKYNDMNKALQAKCKELSETTGRRGGSVNVRFVVAGVLGRRCGSTMTRINVEVA